MKENSLSQPGIYKNLSFEEYRSIPACSNSALSDLLQSPAHCRYTLDHPKSPTPSMILGSAVDCAILQPELFDLHYLAAQRCQAITGKKSICSRMGTDFCLDDGTWYCSQHFDNRAIQIATTNWDARIILGPDEYSKCLAMREAVHQKPSAKTLLDEAEDFQLSFVWREPSGLLCKGRADLVSRSLSTIGDLKTTDDCRAEFFSKSVYNYGYYRQLWFYQRGLEENGLDLDTLAIIAVENQPYHGVKVHQLRPELLEIAEMEMLPAMETFRQCMESGVWPGYSDEIEYVGIPPWAEKQIARRMSQ